MNQRRKMPKSLYAMKPNELLGALHLEKPFQGRQIYRWLTRGIVDYEKMTDLSKTLRSELQESMPSVLSTTVLTHQEDETGAIKIALRLHDGLIIEAVLLTDDKGRSTACLSSQVGCAMGCTFCRTATMGLERNLQAFEIVEQFVHLLHIDPSVSHIVFMGMGEPMANFDEVIKAISFLHDSDGFNIGYRRITISTCGLVPGIKALGELNLPIKLAVSLVAADDKLRTLLMPVNKAYPLTEVKEALVGYQATVQKRFTLEYVMLKEQNTSYEDATKLASFIRGLDVMVNLIPWNPAAELAWETPTAKEISRFTKALEQMGVPYTRRHARGKGVNGACGQLAVQARGRNTQ